MWHDPAIPEVEPRVTSAVCIACRQDFGPSHRRVPCFIVTGIGTHPGGAGRALFVARKPEFRHAQCTNPTHQRMIAMQIPKRKPPAGAVPAAAYPDIEPRTPSYVCAKCHKEFVRGDRVEQEYILLGVGVDPQTGATEAVATANFEVGHCNCNDPQLAGLDRPIILSS